MDINTAQTQLKALYQPLVDQAVSDGLPWKAIKDNYLDTRHQLNRKAKGLISSINPIEQVADQVNSIYAEIVTK